MLNNLKNNMIIAAGLPDAGGTYNWLKGQAQYVVYGIIIFLGIKFLMKKEYGKALGMVGGVGILAFFMFNQQTVINLGKAVANLFGIG